MCKVQSWVDRKVTKRWDLKYMSAEGVSNLLPLLDRFFLLHFWLWAFTRVTRAHQWSKFRKREQFPKTQRCFSWSSGSECRSHLSNGQWVTMTMDPLGMFFWVSNTCCGGDGHLHQPGQDRRNNNPPMVFLVLGPFKRFFNCSYIGGYFC